MGTGSFGLITLAVALRGVAGWSSPAGVALLAAPPPLGARCFGAPLRVCMMDGEQESDDSSLWEEFAVTDAENSKRQQELEVLAEEEPWVDEVCAALTGKYISCVRTFFL